MRVLRPFFLLCAGIQPSGLENCRSPPHLALNGDFLLVWASPPSPKGGWAQAGDAAVGCGPAAGASRLRGKGPISAAATEAGRAAQPPCRSRSRAHPQASSVSYSPSCSPTKRRRWARGILSASPWPEGRPGASDCKVARSRNSPYKLLR